MTDVKISSDKTRSLTSEERKQFAELNERFTYKDQLKHPRLLQLREQADFMQLMLPYFNQFASFSPKNITPVPQQIYKSGLLHTTWNILSYGSTKMFPDFVEFSTERTQETVPGRIEAANLSYIVNLARKKGEYTKAVKAAQRDLIRGECYMFHDYGKDINGNPTRLMYQHIPWVDCWPELGDTDTIVVKNLSKYQFISQFGKDEFKKVSYGNLLNTSHETQEFVDEKNLEGYKLKQNIIQVVYYFDPATLKYQVWMPGSNGIYLYKNMQGKEYPYLRDDGTGFNPVKRRAFYPPSPGGDYFGYGPMDLLIPLARIENNIVNSTAIRAMKAASRPVIMRTNDAEDASRKYDQWMQEVSFGNNEKPFFVSDGDRGTTMRAEVIDEGVDNLNMNFWNDFFLKQATIRTRINFQALTDLAPTGIQDELRIQLEQTANKIVLKSNEDVDRDFAQEDVWLLKGGNSKFHKQKIYMQAPEEDFPPEDQEQIDLLRNDRGEIIVEKQIGSFLKSIDDVQYDVTPRVDGVFDNKTAIEIRAQEKAMALFAGTPAGAKAAKVYADEVIPEAGITIEDLGGTPEGGSPIQGTEQAVQNLQQIEDLTAA